MQTPFYLGRFDPALESKRTNSNFGANWAVVHNVRIGRYSLQKRATRWQTFLQRQLTKTSRKPSEAGITVHSMLRILAA